MIGSNFESEFGGIRFIARIMLSKKALCVNTKTDSMSHLAAPEAARDCLELPPRASRLTVERFSWKLT